MTEKLLLSQRDAAKILGVSARKVRSWTAQGLLPVWPDPDGGRVLYSRLALKRMAAELPMGPNHT